MSPPVATIEHIFSRENEDGSFAYVVELDGTKHPPAGSFPFAHEAWAAGYAELRRHKEAAGLDAPNPVDRV